MWTGLRVHLDELDGGHLRQVGIHTRQGSRTAWDIVGVSWARPPFLSCSGRRRMQNRAQFLGRGWAKAERLGQARRKLWAYPLIKACAPHGLRAHRHGTSPMGLHGLCGTLRSGCIGGPNAHCRCPTLFVHTRGRRGSVGVLNMGACIVGGLDGPQRRP